MLRDYKFLNKKIIENLSPDLLHKNFKPTENPLAGHCYVVSEVVYYLYAKQMGFKPHFVQCEWLPHWYLSNGKKIIDLTASQFTSPIPYYAGIGKGFLTNKPSKRAKILIDRVRKCIQLEK